MFRDLIYDLDDLDGYSIEPDMLLDVPFVPTDEAVIEAMLNLGEVGPKDLLYDLGSGDGRILITAARDRETRGVGVEIDPQRISDAMEDAGHFRVEFLVDFIEDDIFTADFSNATVVTLYLLDSINVQLRPRILGELRPGTRVISHAFNMGDWKADERLELGGVSIYKWIVPAQVAGIWEWDGLNDQRYRIELQQKYQEIAGSAWLADEAAELNSATLTGNRLELEIQGNTFTLIFENNELQSVLEDE
ncbi:class I SAM-dependent methyltransferase [Alcaligenaceae bacterium]|nr:class I SAM-dependent methyltransferase [Alcaligenaceae bacterium]